MREFEHVTIMLQQAALLSSNLLTAAASPWMLQPWLGARQQLLYTAQLSLLYLLFMLLVLVNYTHMTCLYAGPDIKCQTRAREV